MMEEETLEETTQQDQSLSGQSSQESVSDPTPAPSQAPARERRWNLRERPAPVQRLVEMSGGSSQDLEVSTAPAPRKRKAQSEAKTPAPKRKATKSVAAAAATRVTGEEEMVEEDNGMFAAVLSGRSALQGVASEWVDRYQENSEKAMVELVQFFVHCCGCRATITMEMFQNEDTTSIIRSLTENFDEESGDYPLIGSGASFKKFKSSFSEFLEWIVDQCKHSILFDEYMLDTLIIWLVGFTDSQVRAFRHTCTMACMKLVTALVNVANSVSSELDNTQRQIEAEKKRQQAKKGAAGKLEKLLTKRSELQRRSVELGDTMKGVFSSVFVHRYRDVRSEIRSLCLIELGVWMMEYRAHFLEDSYLKYLGWCLYDKVGDVRLSSISVLEALYSSEETAPHLELFTQRFKDRLLSMRLDKEDSVCVKAIRLAGHMLSLDLLEPEDCVEVCELMFVESRHVSHTAAEFATLYLFSHDFMTRAKQAKVPKGHKKPTDAQIQLVELVRFFLEVNIHKHATYFVDSLWDYATVLRDWESVVSLLLDDKAGIVLNGQEEATMIEILVCSVRRAVGSGIPSARTKGKVVSNKERRIIEEERTKLSTSLMVTLPDLISKYGSVAEQASNLAHIPQTFDLELYAEHRLQKHLEALLTHLHQLVTKHMDSSTLDEAAQTFRCLCDPEFSLHSTTELGFNQLMDELVQTFKTHLEEGCQDQSMAEEDSEEVIGLAVSLERIVAFAKVKNLSNWSLPDVLTGLLDLAADGQVPERVMCAVVGILRLDLQWSVATMDETSPSRDSLRELQSRFTRTLRCCKDLLMRGGRLVMREAYMTLCDLLIVFGRQLRACGQLGALAHIPDPGIQQLLQDYVMAEVIEGGGEEEEDSEPTTEAEAMAMAERLNDRRVQLAGFLKLVLFGAVEMRVAAPVFAQYVKHYHHFGDLLKLALARCRESQPSQWYKTIILSLQQVFLRLLEEGGGKVDITDPQWPDLRDLARRYSLPFSFDQLKSSTRQMLVGIHREGINFALSRPEDHTPGAPPPNLQFLSVLGEFSNRLLEVDRTGKKGVLVNLQDKLGEGGWEVGREGWSPLHTFRNMLAGVEGSVDGRGGKGKGKGKKRAQKVTVTGGGGGEEWMTAKPSKVQRTTSPHEP